MQPVSLSVDLESWVHVFNFDRKDRQPLDNGFIESALEKTLETFRKHKSKATFFVVGEIFEWCPESIKSIKDEGHEIAYHSHDHRMLNIPGMLERSIILSSKLIKKFRPVGFRAPQCFLMREDIRTLKRHSFEYDSSSYGPFSSAGYMDGILEIPVSTRPVFASRKKVDLPRSIKKGLPWREIPYGSGLMLSALGSKISLFSDPRGSVFFIHPWQIMRPDCDAFRKCVRLSPIMKLYFKNRRASLEKLLKKYGSIRMLEMSEIIKKSLRA